MTKPLLILVALLIAALAVQTFRASHLRSALLDTREDLEAAQRAAKVLGSYYAKATAIEDAADAAVDETENLEGADAPLDAYGRAVLDRVRNP